MAKIAIWGFGDDATFDGTRHFAEVRPDTDGLRSGTLEITFVPTRLSRATIAAHGIPGRDQGAFTLVLSQGGSISLTCTDGTGSPFRFRTPDAFAGVDDVIQITLASKVAGGTLTAVNCTRRDDAPHDPNGGFIEHLPLRARIDLRGMHGFTFGAASGGVAPFFHGRIERVSLSDTLDPPTVPAPSAEVLHLVPRLEIVSPRRVGALPRSAVFPRDRNVTRPGLRGMRVTTSDGEKPLTRLEIGDEVLTRDSGLKRVRWVGRIEVDWKTLNAQPELQPVVVRKGSLGNGLPEADLTLTQAQRLLVIRPDADGGNGAEEVMTPARRLLGPGGHDDIEAIGVSYVHFFCAEHAFVQINGVWVEAFHPGRAATGVGAEIRRREMLTLFPELRARSRPLTS